MGMTGISRSQVSSICRGINERMQAFLQRPLEGESPYLWLDATYVKVRKNGRVVSVAVIIACAVNSDGRREIIGMGIEAFWLAFLLSLKERGLDRRKAGHLRRAQRPESSATAGVLCQLAALPGPLHAQRAEPHQHGQPVGGATYGRTLPAGCHRGHRTWP